MFAGISKSSFYRVCWHTIFALYDCDHLQLYFPQTKEEAAKRRMVLHRLAAARQLSTVLELSMDIYFKQKRLPNLLSVT
jgi:hypothetical protein